MSGASEQQPARVNVDDVVWRWFRVLAIEAGRSIADYLGQFVRDELSRSKRRHRSPTIAEGAKPAPAQTRTRAGTSIRPAEAKLLKELPRRG